MKSKYVLISLASSMMLLMPYMEAIVVIAGGGQDGAKGTGSNPVARTPSMSRANSWSSSSASPANTIFSSPGAASTSAPSRSQVQQFLSNYNVSKPAINSTSGNLPANYQQSLQTRLQQESQIANSFRSQASQQYPSKSNWFNNEFWTSHGYQPSYWSNSYNPWNYGNWGGVNSWISGAWGNPYYFDDGISTDIDPETQSIYEQNLPSNTTNTPSYTYDSSSGITPATQSIYEQNLPANPANAPVDNSVRNVVPQRKTTSVQATSNDSSNWMSLGVFALTNAENQNAQPNMFFQLALNKSGAISGTYYNQASDKTYPIEGMVDKSTQRAAWKITQGTNSPTFTTGLYNLTLSQSSVEVYFGNQTQNWLMMHVK